MEEPIVNPWLGEQILRLRSVNTDEELRSMYQAEQSGGYTKSWQEFLCETALRAKVKDEPSLLEKREDMPLPEDVKDRLYINQVMVLADLAQFTREALEAIPGFTRGEKDSIYAYLESRGLPVRSCDKPVFFVFYPDTTDDYEQALTYINILSHEAGEVMRDRKGRSYDEALRLATHMYEDALKTARESGIDKLRYLDVVRDYADLLTEHYQFGNQYVSRGEELLLEELKLTENIYGSRYVKTCGVHRKAGDFYMLLDRYESAALHFQEAAEIVKETKGEYDARAGEDIVWVGYALGKLGQYRKALEMYLTGFDISLAFPGNEFIHPEPLCYEISELYAKLGNKDKAEEWMAMGERYKD